MTEREQQPTQVNGRDEAWHRGETIDYDATSGSIIRAPDGRLIQARDLSWAESEQPSSVTGPVLLVTVNSIETKAVLDAAGKYVPIYDGKKTYYDLGELGGVRLLLVRSGMGTTGPDAATVTISEAIRRWNPSAIVAVGVAFGVDRSKQEIGEILVSKQVSLYGPQRASTTPDQELQRIPRGDRVTASPRLLDRFRDGEVHWKGPEPRFGLILSGDMLVDNIAERNRLLELEPEAIGGEMEAAGLYSVAGREKVDWIVVKAICDWADGKKAESKEANQKLAAENAAKFLFFVTQRGGLANWPDASTSRPVALETGSTNCVDIPDRIGLRTRLERQLEELSRIRDLFLDHLDSGRWRKRTKRRLRDLDRALPGDRWEQQFDVIPWHPPTGPTDDTEHQKTIYIRACDSAEVLLGEALLRLDETLGDETAGTRVRRQVPCVQVGFSATFIGQCPRGELYQLNILVRNSRGRTLDRFKLDFCFPDLDLIPSFVAPSQALGSIELDDRSRELIDLRKEEGQYRITYHSTAPLFENDSIDVGTEIGFKYCCLPNARAALPLAVSWEFYADNGICKKGQVKVTELYQSSK